MNWLQLCRHPNIPWSFLQRAKPSQCPPGIIPPHEALFPETELKETRCDGGRSRRPRGEARMALDAGIGLPDAPACAHCFLSSRAGMAAKSGSCRVAAAAGRDCRIRVWAEARARC